MPYRESPVSTVHARKRRRMHRALRAPSSSPSSPSSPLSPPTAYTALLHAVPPRTSPPFPDLTLPFRTLYQYQSPIHTASDLTYTNRQPTPRCRNTDAISSTLFAAVAAFAWPEAGGAASGMQRLVCAYGLAFFAVDLFPTLLTGDALAIVHHVIAIGGYAKVLFSPASDSQVKRVYCTPFNQSWRRTRGHSHSV